MKLTGADKTVADAAEHAEVPRQRSRWSSPAFARQTIPAAYRDPFISRQLTRRIDELARVLDQVSTFVRATRDTGAVAFSDRFIASAERLAMVFAREWRLYQRNRTKVTMMEVILTATPSTVSQEIWR